jgi:hypothetical protein
MDAKAIRQYCKCDETKKEPNAEFSPKSIKDDLLEFEF